ncbi:MAG: fluoride efflux transporter CrcB [Bauldia sp.]|nr:fluoride efflux transporter CrcB [Bauldia sp.]
MNSLAPWFLVFLGGGLGAASRHGVNVAASRVMGLNFPWGTLTVNVVGSFLMGLIAGWLAFRAGINWTQHARLFLTTGFLGGFTTFSAFSLDTALIWERGEPGLAAAYILANVILSIGGLFLGLWIVRSIG